MTNKLIYLDNAATSFPKPESVYLAMDDFNRRIGANPGRSSYSTAREAAKIVSETRALLAQLFNAADPKQIVFTVNATEALNLGLKGLLAPHDHVVTTVIEHNSVLRPLRALEADRGIEVTRVVCDGAGWVDPEAIRQALRPTTKLVCISHSSNVTGAVQDVATIGQFAHENGAVLMVDAAQTAGCLPIDVAGMGIDLLAFAGHKGLLGPQGTGGLYIRPGLEVRPLRQGGTGSQSSSDRQPDKMPDRFEGGTLNTPGIAGLGAGVRFILDKGIEVIRQQERELTERLICQLSFMSGVQVYGPAIGVARAPVVSLTLADWAPLNLAHILASAFGVATRSGLHCAPLIHRHLGTALDGTVRASPSHLNSTGDIDALCKALEQISGEG